MPALWVVAPVKALAPWLMFASLVVAAPRMASLFVAMDRQGAEGAWLVLVMLVAVATSVTFTGGQCWLAWRLTTYKNHRIKLSIAWVVILLGATVIGTVACLLRVVDKGGVATATSPEWLAKHIPALVLALAVAGLPEIMVAAIAVGHGDGVVVDAVVKAQDEQLLAQGTKLLEAEAIARHAIDQLKTMRKRAEDAEALTKSDRGLPAKARPTSSNGNGARSRKKIAGMKLLQEGMGRSEVAMKVKVSRSTVGRWEKEAGKG